MLGVVTRALEAVSYPGWRLEVVGGEARGGAFHDAGTSRPHNRGARWACPQSQGAALLTFFFRAAPCSTQQLFGAALADGGLHAPCTISHRPR